MQVMACRSADFKGSYLIPHQPVSIPQQSIDKVMHREWLVKGGHSRDYTDDDRGYSGRLHQAAKLASLQCTEMARDCLLTFILPDNR